MRRQIFSSSAGSGRVEIQRRTASTNSTCSLLQGTVRRNRSDEEVWTAYRFNNVNYIN
jgi:hypothetical protein